jgi:uncharacterized RDD family membrane protein YckC
MPNASVTRAPVKNKVRLYNHHHEGAAHSESLHGTPRASFKQRLAAFWIDFTLAGLSYYPAKWLVHFLLFRDAQLNTNILRTTHIDIDIHLGTLDHTMWFFWMLAYYTFSIWITNGVTIGKHLLGIRVVSLLQPRITLWQATERALGYGASLLEAGFGFIQYFIHSNRCCVHDRIAETIVVRDTPAVQEEAVVSPPPLHTTGVEEIPPQD